MPLLSILPKEPPPPSLPVPVTLTPIPGKAAIQAQRTSRLATRNPARLERQIADLKALEEAGKLGPREKKALDDAERDLVRVRKARETLGDKSGVGGGGDRAGTGGRGGGLGNRGRREWVRESEESEDTDESVRRIPMPRDTPPPIPRRPNNDRRNHFSTSKSSANGTNANLEPLGPSRQPPSTLSSPCSQEQEQHTPPPKPTVQTVYESKPIVRDLRKEAVEKFVPAAVKRKLDASKGVLGGKLLEEDEARRLEGEGYTLGGAARGDAHSGPGEGSKDNLGDEDRRRLKEEEEKFERELRMEWMTGM